MQFWIVKHRSWRLGSRGKMAEHFFILFQQGIDEEYQAPGNMTNNFAFSTIGLCSLVVDAETRY